MHLSSQEMQWVSEVKYLGLYLTNGTDFKINLTVAKRKYYGCFNTIDCWSSGERNNATTSYKDLLLAKTFVWM